MQHEQRVAPGIERQGEIGREAQRLVEFYSRFTILAGFSELPPEKIMLLRRKRWGRRGRCRQVRY